MTKTFKMLIGDDFFIEERTIMNTLTILVSSISSLTKMKDSRPELNEQRIYVFHQFPLIGFDKAKIKTVSDVYKMIEQSNNSYDWIVTDLDYGEGYSQGGVIIIDAIKKIDSIKAIFTSARRKSGIACLKDLDNVDYIIAPCLSKNPYDSKSELLGETIAKHYV